MSVPCLRDDNVVERRVAPAKSRKADSDYHGGLISRAPAMN